MNLSTKASHMNLFKKIVLVSCFATLTLQASEIDSWFRKYAPQLPQLEGAIAPFVVTSYLCVVGAVAYIVGNDAWQKAKAASYSQGKEDGYIEGCKDREKIKKEYYSDGHDAGYRKGYDSAQEKHNAFCKSVEARDFIVKSVNAFKQSIGNQEALEKMLNDRLPIWWPWRQLMQQSIKEYNNVVEARDKCIHASLSNNGNIKAFKTNFYHSIVSFFKTLNSELLAQGFGEAETEAIVKLDDEIIEFLLN